MKLKERSKELNIIEKGVPYFYLGKIIQ